MEKGPKIIGYYDYRQFLKDAIEYHKSNDRKYSYRYFSGRAGFASTNFLSLVVKGKRNLTLTSAGRISRALQLNKKESAYFEALVFMNQAATHEEKDHYYQKILKQQKEANVRLLDQSSYDYFGNWYHPVVRELIPLSPVPGEAEWIAARIIPRVTKRQVEKSIRLLLFLGLIDRDDRGRYAKREASLTTGAEVLSLQIANFQKQMIRLSAKAIDRFPSNQRDISGVVLSLNQKDMGEVKSRINALRNELIALAEGSTDEDQVIYVQISAFPLSNPMDEV